MEQDLKRESVEQLTSALSTTIAELVDHSLDAEASVHLHNERDWIIKAYHGLHGLVMGLQRREAT